MIYHVVAMADNRVIGRQNKLPWHFPSDLKFFKKLTLGQTVIMGRKTYESIGKALPGRRNFVLSRSAEHAQVQMSDRSLSYFSSIDEALKKIETPRAFIIGGAEIFKQTFSIINGIYLTRINQAIAGDVLYPEIPSDFKETKIEELQKEPLIEVFLYERAKIR